MAEREVRVRSVVRELSCLVAIASALGGLAKDTLWILNCRKAPIHLFFLPPLASVHLMLMECYKSLSYWMRVEFFFLPAFPFASVFDEGSLSFRGQPCDGSRRCHQLGQAGRKKCISFILHYITNKLCKVKNLFQLLRFGFRLAVHPHLDLRPSDVNPTSEVHFASESHTEKENIIAGEWGGMKPIDECFSCRVISHIHSEHLPFSPSATVTSLLICQYQ